MGFLDMVKAREVEATARADTIYRTLVLALVRGAEVQISAWSAERGAFGYADWAVGEPVKDVAGEAQAGDAPVAEAAAAAEGAIAESAAAHDADEPAIVPGPVTNEDLNDWIGKDDPLVLAHAYLLLAYEIFLARLSTPFGKPRPVALRGAVVEPRLGADHPLYRRVWRLVDGESAASDLDHETLHFALRGISLLPRSAPALAALSGTGQPTPQLAAAALVEAFWGVAGGPYNKSNRPADEPWSAYAEVLARAGEWARAAKAVAAGGPAPRVVAGWGAKREGKTPVGCKSYARMVRLWEALPGDKEVTPEELKAAAKGAYGYPFYEAVARQLLVPEELLIPRMGRAVEAQPIFYNQRDKKEAAKEQQGGRVRDDGEKADKEGEAGDWGKRPWGDDRRSTHRRPAGAGREEGSREDGRKEEGRKEEGRRQDGGNRDWRRGRRWQRRDGGEQQGRRDQGADE
ncbi:hypothetical protein DFJ74DRAFT_694508 [Hyaloraphidium curvatum]|nr:hypothetical protein DFJ74DRAFT_694508 [Hyaloraphidium curvatum]